MKVFSTGRIHYLACVRLCPSGRIHWESEGASTQQKEAHAMNRWLSPMGILPELPGCLGETKAGDEGCDWWAPLRAPHRPTPIGGEKRPAIQANWEPGKEGLGGGYNSGPPSVLWARGLWYEPLSFTRLTQEGGLTGEG